jgi:hypothetical protein
MVETEVFKFEKTTSYVFAPDEADARLSQAATTSKASPKFVEVAIPSTQRPVSALQNQGEDVVEAVLDVVDDEDGNVKYNVRFGDGAEVVVSSP